MIMLGDEAAKYIALRIGPAPARTTITRLLAARGPAAILWRVGSIVVDAIQRKALGASSHVLQKRDERLPPALAHEYTAATVILERPISRVVAALDHPIPRRAFTGRPASWIVAVFCESGARQLYLKAAAALGFASTQDRSLNDARIPAVASAQPRWATRAIRRVVCAFSAENNQSTYSFSG